MIGGEHIVAATAKVLDSSTMPCRKVTFRLESGAAGTAYFGGSNLTTLANRYGFLAAGESWTLGPYGIASGIRPSEIYIVGTAGDIVHWEGEEA